MTTRTCDWCRGAIAETARVDAVTCSKRCRQARHRFRAAIGHHGATRRLADGQPRRLAYADPPYPGKAGYYRDHRDYAGEVDHVELLSRLTSTFDAWALSTSASALPMVLSLAPEGTRVAAWFRGERPHNATPLPLNAWEPVLFWGDVRRDPSLGSTRRLDAFGYFNRPRSTDPERVIGTKPAAFCRWIFDLLGATPEDDFTDVYPGSGGFSRGWSVYTEASR